jgi:inhibitor of KinA sporulation pathway (predicted exonuclease)
MVRGNSPSGGLRKSMNSYGVRFEGEPHRAANDSVNTLRFFFYFLQRQNKFEDFRELMIQLK